MSDNTRYAMVIDQRRCVGCHSCVIACKSENNMPDGKSLNLVITEGSTEVDNPVATTPYTDRCTMAAFTRQTGSPRNDFITRACQHCADAPCVKACPFNATHQREDGIVTMDIDKCIGCEACMTACPYGYGSMRVLIKDPKFTTGFDLGDQQADKTKNNTVKKCTFCAHRLKKGEKPFCVEICPARARSFGDINNTGSDVYRLKNTRDWTTVAAKEGITDNTEPAVYLLKP